MAASEGVDLFRRSSYCDTGSCVEVAFTKSTYSADTANCVEVGQCHCTGTEVLVRDSKDPKGPVLSFNRDAWAMFLAGVKDGEFD